MNDIYRNISWIEDTSHKQEKEQYTNETISILGTIVVVFDENNQTILIFSSQK